MSLTLSDSLVILKAFEHFLKVHKYMQIPAYASSTHLRHSLIYKLIKFIWLFYCLPCQGKVRHDLFPCYSRLKDSSFSTRVCLLKASQVKTNLCQLWLNSSCPIRRSFSHWPIYWQWLTLIWFTFSSNTTQLTRYPKRESNVTYAHFISINILYLKPQHQSTLCESPTVVVKVNTIYIAHSEQQC